MCYDLVCFELACTCTTCRKKHFRSTLFHSRFCINCISCRKCGHAHGKFGDNKGGGLENFNRKKAYNTVTKRNRTKRHTLTCRTPPQKTIDWSTQIPQKEGWTQVFRNGKQFLNCDLYIQCHWKSSYHDRKGWNAFNRLNQC